MDHYFISTNNGYIFTNAVKMADMHFTIDEMIADPSLLDDPDTEPGKKHHIRFVMKNDKMYWEFGAYVNE